jgi:methyl-accepting chemotaxis protein
LLRRIRLSIAAKLLFSSLLLLLFLVGIAFLSYNGIEQLEASFQTTTRQASLAQGAQLVETLVYRQGVIIRTYMLFQGERSFDDLDATARDLTKSLDSLEKLATTAKTQEQLKTIRTREAEYLSAVGTIRTQIQAGQQKEAMSALELQALPQLTKMADTAEALSTEITQRANEGFAGFGDEVALLQKFILVVTVGSIMIGLIGALLMARTLSAPIRRLAAMASRVAAGDLTVEPQKVTSRDEVGDVTQTFNQMTESLRSLVRSVQNSSTKVTISAGDLEHVTGQVSGAAQHVTEAVSQVARGATEQSTAAQEASRAVSELRAAIDQIAAGAQEQAATAGETARFVDSMVESIAEATTLREQVQQSTQTAHAAAVAGGRIVETSASAMRQILDTVSTSAGTIRKLGDLSAQIGAITQTITGIADQTNLLALNAAIEAARAGEQGRGFAVVADEVRKLAERAAASANEIGTLIGTIQQGTARAVTEMERISTDVAQGASLTDQTKSALDDIKTAVANTVQDVAQITAKLAEFADTSSKVMEAVDGVATVTEENTASTEEMAAGAEQMNSAITEIATVSEENAAAAEEVSASMEELSAGADSISHAARDLAEVARELQAHVGQFKA